MKSIQSSIEANKEKEKTAAAPISVKDDIKNRKQMIRETKNL